MGDAVGRVNSTLIAANVGVFALQQANPWLLVPLALWPPGAPPIEGIVVHFEPWQLVTYAFLHGGLAHLGLNMLALWMFGRDCERVLGQRRYLELYFAAVLSAALTQLAFAVAMHATAPTIGASGGVFGILLAFAVIFPERRVMLLFPPIPMPAWLFVTLYGLIELGNGVFGTRDGVAHFAHLGGMLGAWLMLRRWMRAARR